MQNKTWPGIAPDVQKFFHFQKQPVLVKDIISFLLNYYIKEYFPSLKDFNGQTQGFSASYMIEAVPMKKIFQYLLFYLPDPHFSTRIRHMNQRNLIDISRIILLLHKTLVEQRGNF